MNREQQKAMFAKQKLNLLTNRKNVTKGQYGHFSNLPTKVAEKLMTGYPNVDPKDAQNNSPTAKAMVMLAKKHNGTLGGYYIDAKDTTRDDNRITFETLYLKMKKDEAEKLRDKIKPDEFNKIGKDTYQFWWD